MSGGSDKNAADSKSQSTADREQAGEYLVHLAGRDILHYLVDAAARQADAQVERREGRWRTYVTAGVAGLAFLGFASFSNLSTDLDRKIDAAAGTQQAKMDASEAKISLSNTEQIEREVASVREELETVLKASIDETMRQQTSDLVKDYQAKVDDSVSKLHVELEHEIAFVQFSWLANRLDEARSVESDDLSTARTLLDQIMADADIVARPAFPAALSDYLGAHFALDNTEEVRRIDTHFRTVLVGDTYAASLLANQFGSRVCGDAIMNTDDLERFGFYRSTLIDRGEAERAWLYEVCKQMRETGLGSGVDELISDLKSMSVDDSAFVARDILNHLTALHENTTIARMSEFTWKLVEARPAVFAPLIMDNLADFDVEAGRDPDSLQKLQDFLTASEPASSIVPEANPPVPEAN